MAAGWTTCSGAFFGAVLRAGGVFDLLFDLFERDDASLIADVEKAVVILCCRRLGANLAGSRFHRALLLGAKLLWYRRKLLKSWSRGLRWAADPVQGALNAIADQALFIAEHSSVQSMEYNLAAPSHVEMERCSFHSETQGLAKLFDAASDEDEDENFKTGDQQMMTKTDNLMDHAVMSTHTVLPFCGINYLCAPPSSRVNAMKCNFFSFPILIFILMFHQHAPHVSLTASA